MSAFHLGAAAAFFMANWTAVLTAAVLYWMGISLGIGMGYHRLLTHRSFKAPKAVEYFLAVCGTLTLEGGPISWVGTHRVHHQKSDRDGDPVPRHRRIDLPPNPLPDLSHLPEPVPGDPGPDLAEPHEAMDDDEQEMPTLALPAPEDAARDEAAERGGSESLSGMEREPDLLTRRDRKR